MNKDFSEENVKRLNEAQNNGMGHPYTCGSPEGIQECRRSKSYTARDAGEKVPYTNENEGVLLATTSGWVCPCGKYTQNWFH